MGLSVSSLASDHLVARIMLLSVVSTSDCHIMPSDPDPAGQSRKRGLQKRPQHYTRPCPTLVPATGPRKKPRRSGNRFSKTFFPLRRYGLLAPAEFRCVNPHPVQHHGELAGKRDPRPLHAAPLSDPQRPALRAENRVALVSMICAASNNTVRTIASPTRLTPPSMSVSIDVGLA